MTRLAWVVAVALCAVGQTAMARPTPTRTVIVFDNSGSMRTNDPQRLAEAATMLYVQLAKRGDQAALVVFDRKARVATRLGPVSRQQRAFSKRLARLRLNGATTDIGRALDVALRTLGPPRPDTSDVVVLLTDGKVDLGRSQRARLAREVNRIRSEVVARYQQRRVPLYTIAFTDQADRALMEDLARRTGGAFRHINSAGDLHQAFSELFAVASSASSLPITNGEVVVDSTVNKTSLVLTKRSPEDENAVVTPDEEVLKKGDRKDGVKWKSSPSYDLVELKKPDPGAWQMLGSDGKPPKAMAIIQDSALDMEVRSAPSSPTTDDVMEFMVELVENGERLRSYARLKDMTVEGVIEEPNRKRRTLLFDAGDAPGRFVGHVTNTEAGQHGIMISAMSPSIQRQWRGSYDVRPPCFERKVRFDEEGPVALVRLAKSCPPYSNVKVEVARILEGEKPRWRKVKPNASGLYAERLEPLGPGEKGVIRLRMRAKTEGGHAIMVEPEPYEMPPAPSSAWMSVVGMRLLYINVPLVILGLVGLFAFKVLKQREEIYDG